MTIKAGDYVQCKPAWRYVAGWHHGGKTIKVLREANGFVSLDDDKWWSERFFDVVPPPAADHDTASATHGVILDMQGQKVSIDQTPEGKTRITVHPPKDAGEEPAMMTLQEWCNIWKILQSIDQYDLVRADVISFASVAGPRDDDWEWWERFRNDPHSTFVHASDVIQAKIWSIIRKRLNENDR